MGKGIKKQVQKQKSSVCSGSHDWRMGCGGGGVHSRAGLSTQGAQTAGGQSKKAFPRRWHWIKGSEEVRGGAWEKSQVAGRGTVKRKALRQEQATFELQGDHLAGHKERRDKREGTLFFEGLLATVRSFTLRAGASE